MKRIVFFIMLFMGLILNVQASKSTITVNDINEVINTGVISSEYKEEQLNLGNMVNISSSVSNDALTISFSVKTAKTSYSGIITMNIDETDGILKSSKVMTKDEMEENPYYQEIYKLIPLWGIEATDGLEEILSYNSDDTVDSITFLRSIFDVCYMEKMGVCYSGDVEGNKTTLIGKIEMNDKSVSYALSVLKKEAREEKNSTFMKYGAYFIMAVLVVYGIVLLSKPKVKPKKFV